MSRSDVFLGQPNTADSQSLPLGNGSLGVAAWAAGGFTAQLNRSDTMPSRLSPGQVQIPGLAAMTSAANFTGTLDLYNGVLNESGGGMTMQAWVPAGKDELIVNVTGANPSTPETADLHLWSGRSPAAAASGAIGTLAQTWADNSQTGSSGQTFGAMAAITAGGTNVTASVVNSTEVQVSFTPNANGSFRVVIASPAWTGGNAATTASTLIGGDATTAASTLLSTQSSWWNGYWANSGLIEANSSDGTAQYMENLRTLYLYDEAASMHAGDYPGSQAGVADMFAYDQDQQDWYPAGYWLWNLRGQIAANMSSGNFNNNVPIFSMYLNDLPAIESWTSAQMGGKPGACVPETMRFNGNGYYNGGSNSSNASCATASSPSYNALNIASGPEIALDIWQQYEDTGSLSFLQQYFPVMEQAATFLLAYQSVGSDGFLHAVANAHESQWAVQDPTDDIAADQALFPAVISAATLLNTDSSQVSQLRTAENQIEPYARVSQSNLSSAAELAADVGVGGRQCRCRGQRRDRRLLPAVGDHPQQREHRPGAGVAVRRDRRQHDGERGQPDRAGRPDLQLQAGYGLQRLELRRSGRGPPGHGLPGLHRPRQQHREVPDLHLRPGRRSTPVRATSRISSRSPTSPPRWTRPSPPTTTGPCASPRPGHRAGTPPARSTSRAAPRSTCRSRAASSPPPPSRRARPRP